MFDEGLGLLFMTAVRTLSFLVCRVGVLLSDRLSVGAFLLFSDLTEVSSTEDEELFSLTFLVPPPDEDTYMSLSMSDVCRLKSAEGVDDWVILRLAEGGCMVLVGVL